MYFLRPRYHRYVENTWYIQYFYRINPTTVTVPSRTETLHFKNAVTFKRHVFDPLQDATLHWKILRYINRYFFGNGKYTVTPPVTVIIVTGCLKNIDLTVRCGCGISLIEILFIENIYHNDISFKLNSNFKLQFTKKI